MSYSIVPREMSRVSAATAAERDQLQDALQRLDPLIDAGLDAARASVPVATELEHFLVAHDAATREILERIAAVLYNSAQAATSYVRGDAEMAQEYGHASTLFDAPMLPAPAPLIGTLPTPDIVTGG